MKSLIKFTAKELSKENTIQMEDSAVYDTIIQKMSQFAKNNELVKESLFGDNAIFENTDKIKKALEQDNERVEVNSTSLVNALNNYKKDKGNLKKLYNYLNLQNTRIIKSKVIIVMFLINIY